MKIMMSAGEASGDMHGGAVAAEIKRLMPNADIFGMGGNNMRNAGVRVVYDIENLGIIGVVEVLKHLRLFFRLRAFLKTVMEEEKPDVFLCVDYPGFNLKMAHVAKEMGIPVVYYIAPTIWAWHKSRVHDVKRDVEQVASIFPFEEKAYREAGAPVTFVGHPLVDTVRPTMSFDEAMAHFGGNTEKKRILLMPGSRKNEVASLLPIMLAAAEELNEKGECQFFLPRADTISEEFLQTYLGATSSLDLTVTEDYPYDLMQICTLCIASSGTATLETALMELPTILLYRLSPLTWLLAKYLVKVSYAGLPNLLMKREVTPELLQGDVTVGNIVSLAKAWMTDEKARQKNIEEIRNVRKALGNGGAVERTAKLVLQTAGANI